MRAPVGLKRKSTEGMPFWSVDSSQTSWAGTVEAEVDATLKIKVEADSAGMGFLTDLRAGSTKFLRLKSTSAQLVGTATPYSLTWDMAAQIMEPPKEFADNDGVFCLEYTFGIVHDATWGKALTCTLVNKLAAL